MRNQSYLLALVHKGGQGVGNCLQGNSLGSPRGAGRSLRAYSRQWSPSCYYLLSTEIPKVPFMTPFPSNRQWEWVWSSHADNCYKQQCIQDKTQDYTSEAFLWQMGWWKSKQILDWGADWGTGTEGAADTMGVCSIKCSLLSSLPVQCKLQEFNLWSHFWLVFWQILALTNWLHEKLTFREGAFRLVVPRAFLTFQFWALASSQLRDSLNPGRHHTPQIMWLLWDMSHGSCPKKEQGLVSDPEGSLDTEQWLVLLRSSL